jgi:hypothetical protein
LPATMAAAEPIKPIKPGRAAPVRTFDPFSVMSDKQLHKELVQLAVQRRQLESAIAADIRHRTLRIGYERYRTVESAVSDTVAVLSELRKREPDVRKRIQFKRQIDVLGRELDGVRRMRNLLKLRR